MHGLKLNGKKTYSLLDMGCETSAIGQRLISDVPLIPTNQILHAANGTAIPLLGKVNLTLSLGKTRVLSCDILTISELIDKLIFGID